MPLGGLGASGHSIVTVVGRAANRTSVGFRAKTALGNRVQLSPVAVPKRRFL
jgi:hypothetical protein